MRLDLNGLIEAARDTILQPRVGARAVMALNLPVTAGWMALLLMAVGSALLSSVAFLTSPYTADPAMIEIFGSPVKLALVQGAVLVGGVALIQGLGRFFGGQGRLSDTLALVSWLEFILILVQIVQMLALLILPVAAELLGFAGLGLFLWLLSHFIAELHGFRSALKVFFALLAVALAFGFVVASLLVMILGTGV